LKEMKGLTKNSHNHVVFNNFNWPTSDKMQSSQNVPAMNKSVTGRRVCCSKPQTKCSQTSRRCTSKSRRRIQQIPM
jgi:hypothetical protein